LRYLTGVHAPPGVKTPGRPFPSSIGPRETGSIASKKGRINGGQKKSRGIIGLYEFLFRIEP
jgi:hypothetical protein